MRTISQGELRQIGKRRARRAALTLLTATLIISAAAGAVPPAAADDLPGGWPATCVALNDLAEASLGRPEKVGIYQRAHADQAEQACQADHRANVRAAFAWASSTSADHIPAEPSPGDWPVTCVALNDLVEPSLGRPENVGIYQRAYGDQAEVACQTDHRSDVQAAFHWALPASAPEPEPTPYAPVFKRVFERPLHECNVDDANEPIVRFPSPLLSSFTLETIVHQKEDHSVAEFLMRLPQFAELSDLAGTHVARQVPQEYAPQSHWSMSRFERLILTSEIQEIVFRWYEAYNVVEHSFVSTYNPDRIARYSESDNPYKLRLSYENGTIALYVDDQLQYAIQGLPYPWMVVEIGCSGAVAFSDLRIDGVAVNEQAVRHLLAESASQPRPDPSSLSRLGPQPDYHCDDRTDQYRFDFPVFSSFTFESTVHNTKHWSEAIILLYFPNIDVLGDSVNAELARQIPPVFAPRRNGPFGYGDGPSFRVERLELLQQESPVFNWWFAQRTYRHGFPTWVSGHTTSESDTSLLDPSHPYTLRLSYESGHFVLYINGRLKHTEKGYPYPWVTLRLLCNESVTFSNIRIEGVGVDEQRVRNFLNQLPDTGGPALSVPQ